MTVWLDFAEIRAMVTLEDVLLTMYGLGDRLKRQGKKLIGPCPIHKGDSPRAFQADLERGVYFCFSGCRKGGNVIDFVVAMDGLTVREAALKLHAKFVASHETTPATSAKNVPPAATPKATSSETRLRAERSVSAERTPPPEKEPVVNEHEEAASDDPVNPPLALRLELAHDHPHILKERGLSLEAAKSWGIGYCRRGMLRSMIAIPVHDEDGELVAYAGRRLKPQDIAEFGKYRFPKNFRRDLVLFNLHRARKLPPENGLILVEGFFATSTLSERGLPNVVASMGCSLSEAQADLLAEHASHVTILYDGDASGRGGADEAQKLLETRAVATSIVRLPDGWKPEHAPTRLLRWAMQGARLLGLRELQFTPNRPSENAAGPMPGDAPNGESQ